MVASKQCFSLMLALSLLINLLPFNSFAENKNELPKLEESKYVTYKNNSLFIYPNTSSAKTVAAIIAGIFASAGSCSAIAGYVTKENECYFLSIALFILTAYIGVKTLYFPSEDKPIFIANHDGLWHIDTGKILWCNIREVILNQLTTINEYGQEISRHYTIEITLKNNKILSIPASYLPITPPELDNIIFSYWEKYKTDKTTCKNVPTPG